jgi:hypothetical protein
MINALAQYEKSQGSVAAVAAIGIELCCAKLIASVQSIHSVAAEVSRFSALQFKALLKTNGVFFAAMANAMPTRCIYEA